MINVEKLVKTFASGTRAVDELDMHVTEGEIYALLGPNGAGKTTTIRVLSTLAGFDAGRVQVAGHDIDRAPDAVRGAIGLVAQQTGVDFFLTGRENLHLQGRLYHLRKAEIVRRTRELADYFDLTDALDRQVMTYSGGMRRKLDIATALIHQPKLLFLDEPTLGLDINSRKSLWSYVQRMNRELGLTILLTTHYLEEADRLSHRVAIINKGKIRAVDTPAALKSSIGGDVLTLTLAQRDPPSEQFARQLQQQAVAKQHLWEGHQLHLYVSDGAGQVPRIAAQAAEWGLTLESLSLSRPSLDDVFLRYTGASLAGQSDEGGGDEWWKQWAGKGGGNWSKRWQQDNAQAAASDQNTAETDWRAQAQPGRTQDSQQHAAHAERGTPGQSQQWPAQARSGPQSGPMGGAHPIEQPSPSAADGLQHGEKESAASTQDTLGAGSTEQRPERGAHSQADPGNTPQWPGSPDDWKKWQQSGESGDWQKWQKK